MTNKKLLALKTRANFFAQVRHFFEERGVLEVDTPILGRAAPIDTHIDVIHAEPQEGQRGFLHTSPEYAMKRLLSMGIGDIYQMGHVFRKGEIGPLHNPEFTLIEWYRLNFSFEEMVAETLSLIHLFLGPLPATHLSYREAFRRFAGVDPFDASLESLLACAEKNDIPLPQGSHLWDRDTALQFLMGFLIEPQLRVLTVLGNYPPSQAALARTVLQEGELVAKRFEIYIHGVELANGFHELADRDEQRKRLEKANRERVALGKEELPLDERFLQALGEGFPDCCGVAVGFDRLLLVRQGGSSLAELLPFPWEEA